MPSSYTTSLRLTLPATGELSGQWGNTVNTGITELLDAAVAGTASISTWGGAGVAYTLSNNSGTADEARKMFIVATGSPGEAKNVICPAVSKFYVFRNDTTGGFALTLKTSGGTGIAVPAGQYKFLYCDGTNVVEMFNSVASLRLSSLTSGRVTYAGTAGLLQDSANFTFNGTDLTVSGAVNAGTVNATTLDLTNIEVTNIKAKDGTASASIADSTGVMSLVANPVFSGGTANGVLYLNGSKVATSGSALTFDGAALNITPVSGNATSVLTGVSTSGAFTNYKNATADHYVGANNNAASLFGGIGGANSLVLAAYGNLPIGFGINGSEQMRLTSTGLGIGTSSPASKLEVYNSAVNAAFVASNPATWRVAQVRNDGTANANNAAGIAFVGRTDVNPAGIVAINSTTGGGVTSLAFLPVSSNTPFEAMRLDSSGNLGIGTSSPAGKLTVKTGTNENLSVVTGGSGDMRLSALNDAGSATVQLSIQGSPLYFRGVGGAINATLDSSGNLGLGVTPSTWTLGKAFQVNSLDGAVVWGYAGAAQFGNNFYYNGGYLYATTAAATRYVQSGGAHQWFTAPSGTAGNAISFTQAMTLDASGNLQVGTSSGTFINGKGIVIADATAARLKLADTDAGVGTSNGLELGFGGAIGSIYNLENGALLFGTNNTERARITSGGYFKASNAGTYAGGATSAAHEFDQNSTSLASLYVYSTANATGNYGINIGYPNRTPNDTGNEFLICGDSTATRATIRSNGGIANYQANDVNLSDRREKTNFAPAKSYLDTICAIPVQTFEYIDQSADDPGLTLGVVAQDVQAVAPELVMESNWGTEDNPKMRLSIYQTDLQYALMKCVQELKAELDATKARLAALEAQP